MTARQKIEWITNHWYAFAVFGAIYSLMTSGIGFFSMFFTAAGLVTSVGLTWLFGKLLLARSSLTRSLLVFFSVLGILFHGLAIAWTAWRFVGSWKLALLLQGAFSALTLMMHGRSFGVLTDKDVKSYIASS